MNSLLLTLAFITTITIRQQTAAQSSTTNGPTTRATNSCSVPAEAFRNGGRVMDLRNAVVPEGARVQPGSIVRLECAINGQSAGTNTNTSLFVCTRGGSWVPAFAKCASTMVTTTSVTTTTGTRLATASTQTPLCRIPEEPNGVWSIGRREVRPGTMLPPAGAIFLTCAEDYLVIGNPRTFCQRTGQWYFLPSCAPRADSIRNCGMTPKITNGYVRAGGSQIGERRTIVCYDNHYVDGQVFITCNPDGEWSTPGRCIPVGQIAGRNNIGNETQQSSSTMQAYVTEEQTTPRDVTKETWFIAVMVTLAIVAAVAIALAIPACCGCYR